nr:SIMPL domain-containing protein [Sphaerochaetaceae bacterium]
VTASATVMIEADTASFTISSESLGKSSEEARRESTRLINTAIDILVSEFGVDKKELVTNHMTSSPYYEWVDGKRELVGQMARGSVQVTISDLDSVGHMYDRLSSVDGLSVSSVYFSKKDTSADVSEARRLAVIEARKKAEDYASGLGLEVVKVISITDGAVLNNVRYNGVLLEEKAMMATGAVSDSSEYYRGDLSVSDTVSVVFGLR